ncbi:MAG: nucleotidyltransferase domain-containing protein [Halothiobacillaceae bacterium]
MTDFNSIAKLQEHLRQQPALDFAVLVGSRAHGNAQAHSDWDIALHWQTDMDWMQRIARGETLRRELAQAISAQESDIDLIDLANSNLAMRALVAEEGVVLCGENSVAWARFLRRTWRELEEYYWEQCYAA